MSKPLKIISFDGIRGAGKTSQISMLVKYMQSIGRKCMIFKTDKDTASEPRSLELAEAFLGTESNGLAILDGSIARPMVTELVEGALSNKVIDKYKHSIHKYEVLDRQYGIVGILLVMDNLKEANGRVLKRDSLTSVPELGIEDISREKSIVSGMRIFNNHIASKTITFHTFNVEPEHSILQIHKEVMDYLTKKYDIPKPPRNDNDW